MCLYSSLLPSNLVALLHKKSHGVENTIETQPKTQYQQQVALIVNMTSYSLASSLRLQGKIKTFSFASPTKFSRVAIYRKINS